MIVPSAYRPSTCTCSSAKRQSVKWGECCTRCRRATLLQGGPARFVKMQTVLESKLGLSHMTPCVGQLADKRDALPVVVALCILHDTLEVEADTLEFEADDHIWLHLECVCLSGYLTELDNLLQADCQFLNRSRGCSDYKTAAPSCELLRYLARSIPAEIVAICSLTYNSLLCLVLSDTHALGFRLRGRQKPLMIMGKRLKFDGGLLRFHHRM